MTTNAYILSLILVVLAFIFLLLAVMGRAPLWASVICLIAERVLAVAVHVNRVP